MTHSRPAAATADAQTAPLPELPAPVAIPRDDDGPVFAAPWEGQVFAAAVSLRAAELLSWPDFAAYLAEEIRAAGPAAAAPASAYYRHWLDALERILIDKKLASAEELARMRAALRAAQPHHPPPAARR